MWNIVKAQYYQLKRDKVLYIMAVMMLLFCGFNFFDMHWGATEAVTGSLCVAQSGFMMVVYCIIFFMVVTIADVVGNDFLDKTVNYEILSGHSRKQVFFGRVIPAVLHGVLGTFCLVIVYPVIATILNGWGTSMDLKGVVIRHVLLLFVLFRIACEYSLVAIITKNTYATYLIGFILSFEQMMVLMFFSDLGENAYLTGIHNCVQLTEYSDWHTFFLNGKEQMFYESAVTSEMVIGTIGVSLFAGILSLVLGYVYFKHDDLN